MPAAETTGALCAISEGLEELVAILEATRPGRWCLVITADHGMTRVDTDIAARDIVGDITDKDVPMTLDGGALYVWAGDEDRGKIADALRQTEGTILDTDLEVPLIVVGPKADAVNLEKVNSIIDIRSVVEMLFDI